MTYDSFMKEVFFNEYCHTCVNADLDGMEDPCFECLNEPCREYSHKPANYVEAKKKIGKTTDEVRE